MDIVITYVDGNDPVWKKDYEKYTNVPIMEKRFRDWGTLKYLLRGIEVNMPFIDNVFLVVSHPSQVPQWADQSELKIVLHKDIIPEEHLPTFNCNPIEMHLHRIEGLSEQYLYFNDDLYPLAPCAPEDFFRDGKGVLGFTRHWFVSGMYKQICKNSDTQARKAAGLPASRSFIRPQHTCTAMLKSSCESLYAKLEKEILALISRTRTGDNLNQYLFLDYQLFTGKMIAEKISNKHFSVALASPKKLASYILKPSKKLMCVNDVRLSDKKYEALRKAMIDAFEIKYPNKSRFEK